MVGPTGKVYAVDVEQSALDFFAARLAENPSLNPHDNIELVHNEFHDVKLAPSSVDIGLMLEVHFHNAEELDETGVKMVESVYEAIRPGGWLLVEDITMDDGRAVAPSVVQHYTAAGFELSGELHYFTGRSALEEIDDGRAEIFVALFQRPPEDVQED